MNLFMTELCTISGDQIHIEVFQAKHDSDTANWPDVVDLGIFRNERGRVEENDVTNCVVFYYEKGKEKISSHLEQRRENTEEDSRNSNVSK